VLAFQGAILAEWQLWQQTSRSVRTVQTGSLAESFGKQSEMIAETSIQVSKECFCCRNRWHPFWKADLATTFNQSPGFCDDPFIEHATSRCQQSDRDETIECWTRVDVSHRITFLTRLVETFFASEHMMIVIETRLHPSSCHTGSTSF
jgi:hypothetical protein